MGAYHTLAGALYMTGWFFFLDGAILAKDTYGDAYNFVDALCGILTTFGIILFAMTNIRALMPDGADDSWAMMGGGGGGGDDENAPMKARVMFFVAAAFQLAGMTVAIWQLAGPRQNHPWTGWSMLIMVFSHMIAAFFLGIGQTKNPPEESSGF